MKTIRQAKVCYILCSLLFSVAGLVLIVYPHISALLLCYIMGAVTVFYGLTKIFGYISHDLYNLAFQFDLSLGIFTTFVGLVMLVKAEKIIIFLPVVIGVFVMIDGVFKLQTAVDARKFGLSNWWLILLGGIICVALSLVLIFNPFGSGNAIMVLIGVSLLIDGLQNLFNAFYTVRIMKSNTEKERTK